MGKIDMSFIRLWVNLYTSKHTGTHYEFIIAQNVNIYIYGVTND